MAKIFILELAKKLGKTALEIADETGLNRNTVGALFRGDTDVRLSTIEKICQTYDVSLNEVLEIANGRKIIYITDIRLSDDDAYTKESLIHDDIQKQQR
jgi:transcriptional regulator with XRE-family HTH domain